MSQASYKVLELEDGTPCIQTTVKWTRSYTRRNSACTFFRHNEVFSQKKFLAWCKRNKLTPLESDLKALPVTVWWE